MRQFDLKAGFHRLCPGGEDIEDDFTPVEDLRLEGTLEITRLRGRQIVIEDHDVGIAGLHQVAQFLELAGADIGRELNLVPFLSEFGDDGGTRRGRQPTDFIAGIVGRPGPFGQRHADQDGLLTGNREIISLGIKCFADRVSSTEPGVIISIGPGKMEVETLGVRICVPGIKAVGVNCLNRSIRALGSGEI